MADFLASLAARSLGQLQSVQPRRASRFEADAAMPAIEPTGSLELEAEPEQPAFRAAPPATDRSARQDNEEPDLSPRLPVTTRQTTTGLLAAREVEPGQSSPEVDVVAERYRDPNSAQQPRATSAASGSRARSEPALDAGQHLEPQSEPLDMRGSPPPSKPGRFPQPAPATRDAPVIDLTQPNDPEHGDRREPERPNRASSGDALRVITSVASPGEEETGIDSQRDSTAAPHITVSIGRIEVKAARAPEPARPAQPPALPQPRLSLGEYLERSRRGR